MAGEEEAPRPHHPQAVGAAGALLVGGVGFQVAKAASHPHPLAHWGQSQIRGLGVPGVAEW